jgi:hypothetical protein
MIRRVKSHRKTKHEHWMYGDAVLVFKWAPGASELGIGGRGMVPGFWWRVGSQ